MRFAAPSPTRHCRCAGRSEDGKPGRELLGKSRAAIPAARPAPASIATPGPRGRKGRADNNGSTLDSAYEHVVGSGDRSRRPGVGATFRARNPTPPGLGGTAADAPRDVDGDHQLARLLQIEEDGIAAALLAMGFMGPPDAGLGTAIKNKNANSEAGASAATDAKVDRASGGLPATTIWGGAGRCEGLDCERTGPAGYRADRGEREGFAGLAMENVRDHYEQPSTADGWQHRPGADPPLGPDSNSSWSLTRLLRRLQRHQPPWGCPERNSAEPQSGVVSPPYWTATEFHGVGNDVEPDGYRGTELSPQTWEADIAAGVDVLGVDEMNYEDLTALADRIGPAAEAGATEHELDTLRDVTIITVDPIPGEVFDDKGVLQLGGESSACLFVRRSTCCSICLDGYTSNPLGAVLNDCGHIFHASCVKAWLRNRKTCPIDRLCVTF